MLQNALHLDKHSTKNTAIPTMEELNNQLANAVENLRFQILIDFDEETVDFLANCSFIPAKPEANRNYVTMTDGNETFQIVHFTHKSDFPGWHVVQIPSHLNMSVNNMVKLVNLLRKELDLAHIAHLLRSP